jgi:tRNA G46 methylase TrmB
MTSMIPNKQKELFANLKEYEINISSLKDSNFLKGKNLFLEIGFGSGEIIYKQAKLNPNNIYIGVEYYKKGITQLIEKIIEKII